MMKRLFLLLAMALCAASAFAQTAGIFVVRLTNGDRFTGRIVSLTDSALTLALESAGGTSMAIPVAKLDGLERVDATEPGLPAGPHRLELASGGSLAGKLLSYDGKTFVFEADGIGKLSFAAGTVSSLAVNSGEDASAPAAAVPAKGKLVATVELPNGLVIEGTDPAVAAGNLSLTVFGGQKVTIPLRALKGMELSTSSGELPQTVLVWGAFGDEDEEVAHTVAALRATLPKAWKIETSMDATPSADLKAKFARAGVVVICEMEDWDYDDDGSFAASTKPLISAFIRRGGRFVLLCPSGSQAEFLRETGILGFDLVEGDGPSSKIAFTSNGKRWGAGLKSGSFSEANRTASYELPSGAAATAIATAEDGSAVIFMYRSASSVTLVFGPDFFESNSDMDRVLSNLVSM